MFYFFPPPQVREKYVEVICALAHFRSPLYSEFSNSSNVNTQSRVRGSLYIPLATFKDNSIHYRKFDIEQVL